MAGNEEQFKQVMNQGHTAAWDQAWDQAASYYRQALSEIPDNPKALTNLGLALYELGEYQDALKSYMRAGELSPKDPVPQTKIAEILERMGQIQQAIKVYLQAAELHAINRDFEKAIENWSHIVSMDPENLSAHSRLALIYERLGRKQQSIIELISFASLMQQRGETQKALASIKHALQISPESNEAKQALKMIQAGQPLPKPQPPRGMTDPISIVLSSPKIESIEDSESIANNPIEASRIRAISILAALIFEPVKEDKQVKPESGIQSLMRGGDSKVNKQMDNTKITLHLTQAIDSQSRNEYTQAREELERAMNAGLDNVAAYYELGFLLLKENRLESAVRNLQRAVKHEDYALGSRLLLGQTLIQLDRINEASTQYLEALKIADTHVVSPDKSAHLAGLYDPIIEANVRQQDIEYQEKLCKNIEELLLRPDWEEHLRNTRQKMPEQPDLEMPTPIAEMLTEAKSGQVVELFSQIQHLARSGNFRTAMEEAFYTLQYAPTYLPLHTFIGDLLVQENHVQEAVDKYTMVAKCYNVRGEVSRGINTLNRVISLSPMNLDARNLLIEAYIARGEINEAIQEYIKTAEIYYNLADLNMARKTYLHAYQYLHQINAEVNLKINILNRIADIYMQSLDWRQALQVYKQISNLEPNDNNARQLTIDLYLRLGQVESAITELDDYLSYMIKSGQQDDAIYVLEELVESNPGQTKLRRRLADLYRKLGRIEDAVRQLDQTGEILLQAGDKEGAVKTILAILALDPPNASDYRRLLEEIKNN